MSATEMRREYVIAAEIVVDADGTPKTVRAIDDGHVAEVVRLMGGMTSAGKAAVLAVARREAKNTARECSITEGLILPFPRPQRRGSGDVQ